MSYEGLSGNPEAQQRVLAAVAAKDALTRLLTGVTAYSLGAIPLSRDDDGIALATFPRISRGALAALRRHLGADVKPVEFDENVMAFFIDRIYLRGKGVNIHTFRNADFLDDPANDARLHEPKIERPEPTGSRIDPTEIVLADIHLGSELHNLDLPQAARLDSYRLGEFCPAFRRQGDRWLAWCPEPLAEGIPLLVQYSEDYAGEEFYRDLTAAPVEEFPFILFPSEIQILGLRPDGALDVYVDGATHILSPGDHPDLHAEYWLVRHGYRFHRKLLLRTRGIWKAKRSEIDYAPPFRGAGAEELGKWLRP